MLVEWGRGKEKGKKKRYYRLQKIYNGRVRVRRDGGSGTDSKRREN